jgi:hypothetical protein
MAERIDVLELINSLVYARSDHPLTVKALEIVRQVLELINSLVYARSDHPLTVKALEIVRQISETEVMRKIEDAPVPCVHVQFGALWLTIGDIVVWSSEDSKEDLTAQGCLEAFRDELLRQLTFFVGELPAVPSDAQPSTVPESEVKPAEPSEF